MWEQVSEWTDEAFRLLGGMDRTHWMIVFAIVVVVGFFCMRGFGSRANY